ncbi:MAG: DUF748 domain-containing protein, partial [Cyanobacteriota bacterium]|nr:DUF748 domain-containing protein [Cyanobacteriota bacterium]
MTNSSDPNTESISPKPRRWRRILIWGGVGLGVTTIAVGTAATWFVKERLAPIIGDIVGNIVQRPVIVGPVERVTPTSIRFGPSSIPATENNPNNASTEAVDVKFSLLSLLWKPEVRLDLTLVNPDVYLEENAQGEWIRTELKLEGDPPVDIQFGKVGVRNADITLKPFITTRAPKVVGLDVEQAFVNISDENQRIRGNVNGEFDQGGTFSIRANTFLPDGKIDGRVRANQIQLSQFSDLVKVPDFALQSGAVNANLQVNLEEYALSRIQGKANLDRVQIDLADLERPIQPINGDFRFSGTQVEIQQLTTGLEGIDVDVAGIVKADPKFDLLKTQFDITTNIEPTQLSTLLDIAENIAEEEIAIPVPISGEIQTEVDLIGTVQNPVATIAVETTQATQIDKITLDNINTTLEVKTQLNDDFSLTADPKIDIKSLQIQPAFGGNITGEGEVTLTGLKELISSQTQPEETAELPQNPPALLPVPTTPTESELPINPDIKLDLDVDNVGLDSLVRSYGLSSPFRWGSVSADAEVSGNLNTLKGTAEFSLPTATTPIFGQATLDQNTLNSTISIAEGNVNIKAQRNAQNLINANVNASQVALEPLVNAGLLFANLDPNLKSDLARVDVSD